MKTQNLASKWERARAWVWRASRRLVSVSIPVGTAFYLVEWAEGLENWPAPIVVVQALGMISLAAWLCIGIWRGRLLGVVRRAVYDPETDWIRWQVVGIAFRWSYKTENHGEIYEPWNGKMEMSKRSKHVRYHHININMWEFRPWLNGSLGGMSVCGIEFRAGNMTGDSPAGKQFECRVGSLYDLYDRLWLRQELLEFARIVRPRMEYLGAGELERLMRAAVQEAHVDNPLYGGLLLQVREVFNQPSMTALSIEWAQRNLSLIDDATKRNNDEIAKLRLEYILQIAD